MGARRLWALIEGMPEDAAWRRPDVPGWTQQDELAAQQIELMDLIGRLLIYWMQVAAAPYYKGLEARMPPPFVTRYEHPDRPKPSAQDAGERLPPKLTAETARRLGLIKGGGEVTGG